MANDGTVKLGVEFESDDVKKAFESLKSEAKQIERSLKEVDKALKLDPKNTEIITEKQKLLGSAIENSKKQISLLASEMQKADSSATVGKNADAYQSLTHTLSGTVSQLKEYENQLENLTTQSGTTRGAIQSSSESVEDLSNEFQQAERSADDFESQLNSVSDAARSALDGFQQAESGADSLEAQLKDVSGAADEAEHGLDDVGNSTSGVGDCFTIAKGAAATFAGNLATKVVDAALQAAEAIWQMDEATEEYRESMGLLNTAFETAGFNAEKAQEAYRGFFEILGDTGQATEASQLLAQLATNSEDISKWVEIAAGVYGTFGDSLPIESLIEAANETAKTGEVTGALADALNWVGISEEEVGAQLSAISTETDRARYLMELLSTAYSDAAESFYENNKTLIESNRTQAELDNTTSELGESVAELKSSLHDLFGPVIEFFIKSATGLVDGFRLAVEAVGDAFDWVGEKVGGFFGFFTGGVSSSKKGTSTSRSRAVATNGAESPAARSFSVSTNSTSGISTTASPGIEGLVPNMREKAIAALATSIPSSVQRVEFVNSNMIPSSVSAFVPRHQSEQFGSNSGHSSGGEQRVKLDIGFYPREASMFLRPYLRDEDRRSGTDLVE